MGAPVVIGSILPDATLFLKYNSTNDFSIFFWDDANATVSTDLTGAVATIEVDATGVTNPFATGVRVGVTNEMKFTITATTTTVTWDNMPFRAVLTKGGSRFVYASGKVRIQK
jgi:tRNA G26 N,N-dimethylase Trm1